MGDSYLPRNLNMATPRTFMFKHVIPERRFKGTTGDIVILAEEFMVETELLVDQRHGFVSVVAFGGENSYSYHPFAKLLVEHKAGGDPVVTVETGGHNVGPSFGLLIRAVPEGMRAGLEALLDELWPTDGPAPAPTGTSHYHAYHIYDAGGGAAIGVDTDAAALWRRLASDLNAAESSGGVETIEVGGVVAESVDAAITAVRADKWVRGYGVANGVNHD